MYRNRNTYNGIIMLIIITAIVSFTTSTVAFWAWDRLTPKHEIYFDTKNVSVENVKKYTQVRSILEDYYYVGVDENKMLEGSIAGMTDSLKDPYTVYFNAEQMKMFTERAEGSYVGIGVTVMMDNNGLLNILEPMEGSPAKEAGLQKGDVIVKVDGKDVTTIRDEDAIVAMIKGEENTKVKLTIFRPSDGNTHDFNIMRKKIKVVNLQSEVLPGNIGYIKIMSFDNEIANYFDRSLNDLLAKKIKGLIIDLRDNPGGDYDQVVQIADRLLPEGLIVYTENKDKKREERRSDKLQLDLPIALLVNGNSASASEVLAGAIKDNKKGTLVGTKTFGKGVVQALYSFDDGSGLKVTIARYFTPSGVCIQGIGIKPDIEIGVSDKYKDVPASQIPRSDDAQLKKAEEVIKAKAK